MKNYKYHDVFGGMWTTKDLRKDKITLLEIIGFTVLIAGLVWFLVSELLIVPNL